MYIDLNNYLTQSVPEIDFNKIRCREYKYFSRRCFYWNDSIYFSKSVNLNEFIGEQLAIEINLRTVNFNLFKNINSGEIIIASKSFINPNSKYYPYPNELDIYKPYDNNLINKCIDYDNYKHLINNILKMLALDIYMGQRDRWYPNFQLEKYDTGYLDLAPVYDYSDSSWDDDLLLNCELYNFENEEDYEIFFDSYPNILEHLKKLKKLELSKILEKIELSKGIKLPQSYIDYYLKKEENTQKKLEKIIK